MLFDCKASSVVLSLLFLLLFHTSLLHEKMHWTSGTLKVRILRQTDCMNTNSAEHKGYFEEWSPLTFIVFLFLYNTMSFILFLYPMCP